MKSLTDRLKLVYKDLGTMLDRPEAFGLGERAPAPLVNALTEMRKNLREELIELKRWMAADDLTNELSQDADNQEHVTAQRRRIG